MMKTWFLLTLALLPASMLAQTEVEGSGLQDSQAVQPSTLDRQLRADSMSFRRDWMRPELAIPKEPVIQSYTQLTKAGGTGLRLWQGASVAFYGTTSHLPGLLTTETGTMALHQDLDRWHFTTMGIANKYWMPWQRTLSTQYGFGGTIAYDLSETVTLHAFGYYYANRIQVGPAMSPYVNNTTYGGYADVRFSNVLGANVGVRRYVNPMNGKWTTEPIVNPYIKIGKDSKIELPLGNILKTFFWGDRDNPMNYRPHPMSRPPVK